MSEDFTQEDFDRYMKGARQRTIEMINNLERETIEKAAVIDSLKALNENYLERIEALELAIREHKEKAEDNPFEEDVRLWSVLEDSEDDKI